MQQLLIVGFGDIARRAVKMGDFAVAGGASVSGNFQEWLQQGDALYQASLG